MCPAFFGRFARRCKASPLPQSGRPASVVPTISAKSSKPAVAGRPVIPLSARLGEQVGTGLAGTSCSKPEALPQPDGGDPDVSADISPRWLQDQYKRRAGCAAEHHKLDREQGNIDADSDGGGSHRSVCRDHHQVQSHLRGERTECRPDRDRWEAAAREIGIDHNVDGDRGHPRDQRNEQQTRGLVFSNLVDFDMLYGHRRDTEGYARALEYFDSRWPEIETVMRNDDLVIITADHGNDPTYPGTDHTREYAPLLVFGKVAKAGINLGSRRSLADIGKTIAENFGLSLDSGESFLDEIVLV